MSETRSYDVLGNLARRVDFNGSETRYTYDQNSKRTGIVFWDGTTTDYSYLATGQRAMVSDQRGATDYNYDLMGRLIGVKNPDGTWLSYTYDEAGNRTTVSTPFGTTAYSFDALNRLVRVVDAQGQTTTYSYNEVGSREAMNYSNGTQARYTYDPLNRLTHLENHRADLSLISSYRYTLDNLGRRVAIEEQNNRSTIFEYDALHRLVSEIITDPSSGNRNTSYIYDPVGNRLSKNENGDLTNYSYDANDRILTHGGTSYSYDPNGNTHERINQDGTTTYLYNAENRLVAVETPGGTLGYAYDADGIRISATVNGLETGCLIDPNRDYAQVLAEIDGQGAATATYTYGTDLISQDRLGQTHFYHYDGHGSTTALSDQSATITDTYAYEAFGNLIARTGTTTNYQRYSGERYDPNLGFIYLRARHYNPSIGRFHTMDTWQGNGQDPITLHKYLYANANPVMGVDPSGHTTLMELMTSANNYLKTVGANATAAYQTGGRAIGMFFQSVGARAEAFARQVFQLFPQATVQRNINLIGTGGKRFIDFLVSLGNKIALIEVKYGLPRVGGPALKRLVAQLRTATSQIGALQAEEGARAGAVVLWTLKSPSPAQIRLIEKALGDTASNVERLHGVFALWKWMNHFFLGL